MQKIPLLLLLACTSTTTLANNFKTTQDAIDYRQSVFSIIAHNFGDMGAMMKGKKPFDAKLFSMRAENVMALSKLPMEGFIENSDRGNTDAKSSIWKNASNFESQMTQFQQNATKLAQTAASGDLKSIKKAFGVTAKSCKACHDKYKKD